MIGNEGQLKIVREQLAIAEDALESLRRDVFPKNPSLFHTLSEPYVEMIDSLRGDIDVFLGVSRPHDSAFEFAEINGVIRSIDLDEQTFVLRDRTDGGIDLLCEYGADLEDVIKQNLGRQVFVSGALVTSVKTSKSKLSADVVLVAPRADAAAKPVI